jgi:2'-5' RNA ligase
MSDLDTIRIPSFTSFAIKNIVISRGLAKEIVHKRNDHQALYNISLNNHLTLQAVGYISRCDLKEIQEAPAIRQ